MSRSIETASIPLHRAAVGEEEVTAVAEVHWLWMADDGKKDARIRGSVHELCRGSTCGGGPLWNSRASFGSRGDWFAATATGEVVNYLRGRPVLVDVDPVTLNIDVSVSYTPEMRPA